MDNFRVVIISVALAWAAAIITLSTVMEGTNFSSQVLPILSGGAAGIIIVLGGTKAKRKL